MSSQLKRLREIQDKIDALSLRERVLVLLSVVAVVYLLWNLFLYGSVVSKQKLIKGSLVNLQQELQAKTQESSLISSMLAKDPNVGKKKELGKLLLEIEQQESKIHSLSSPLIHPEKLAEVLETVLKQDSRLKLVSMQTLPPGIMADQSTMERISAVMKDGLYKHAVRLHLQGGYADTLQYLEALEDLPWHFYWENLEYIVTNYPTADIFLEVYTISTGEGVFGV